MKNYDRIAIIGNSCGGKTRLARNLAAHYRLPLIHVDQVQFMTGLKFRPYQESIQILQKEQEQQRWIIDGFGPLDILQKRLELAELIIMIDLPLWQHFFWATKRVLKSIFTGQRKELPANSSERNLKHVIKLYKTIYQIHTKMRPEMLRILSREHLQSKTLLIQDTNELNKLFKP